MTIESPTKYARYQLVKRYDARGWPHYHIREVSHGTSRRVEGTDTTDCGDAWEMFETLSYKPSNAGDSLETRDRVIAEYTQFRSDFE